MQGSTLSLVSSSARRRRRRGSCTRLYPERSTPTTTDAPQGASRFPAPVRAHPQASSLATTLGSGACTAEATPTHIASSQAMHQPSAG